MFYDLDYKNFSLRNGRHSAAPIRKCITRVRRIFPNLYRCSHNLRCRDWARRRPL